MDICTGDIPQLIEMEKGHSVACHLYDGNGDNDIKKMEGSYEEKISFGHYALILLLVFLQFLQHAGRIVETRDERRDREIKGRQKRKLETEGTWKNISIWTRRRFNIT